jgi:hypothetical protein
MNYTLSELISIFDKHAENYEKSQHENRLSDLDADEMLEYGNFNLPLALKCMCEQVEELNRCRLILEDKILDLQTGE